MIKTNQWGISNFQNEKMWSAITSVPPKPLTWDFHQILFTAMSFDVVSLLGVAHL